MTVEFANFGIRKGSLGFLEPILRTWQKLNSDSNWLDDQDAPWWYNERATLSFFAGAVWRCQGWAFEEFSTDKITAPARKPRTKKGRCDIVFNFKGRAFVAEAKQQWPVLGGNVEMAARKAHEALETACRESLQSQETGFSSLGIVFISPSIHMSKGAQIDRYLASYIGELASIKGTTLAWAFPKAARNLRPDNRYNKYAFPGVILMMKKAA